MKTEQALQKFGHMSRRFLKKNSATILTCVAAVGVVGTAYHAAKATPKALRKLEVAREEKGEELTKVEVVKVAAPAYVPAVLFGVSTITCIFAANALNKKQQAALMSAYALLDNTHKQYRNKVAELYGEEVDRHIKNEVAKDTLREAKLNMSSVTDENKVWFYDEFSGQHFESSWDRVREAEYEINKRISVNCGAYLNEFYELLDVPQPEYGDYLGWAQGEMMETSWNPWLDFFHETIVLDDGLECVTIVFGFEPTYDFENY